MDEHRLRLYRALSRAPYPKSYVGKIFLTAFLGIHVPLLTLLIYFVRSRVSSRDVWRILWVMVPATLGGTGLTFWAMYELSAPTTLASQALRRYLATGELPELPVEYTDRAGRLMADVQHAVERLDEAVHHLEDEATTDHLTGAYNRRAAEDRLGGDVERAERGGGTLSLILLDLDKLKAVNDVHGHGAGDACISHFADVLGRNLSDGDWAARWGGDEFVIGMLNALDGKVTAERVLGRVVDDLREHPVLLPDGEKAYLTFSAGVCLWKRGDDIHSLILRADEALYHAKAEGGNTVVQLD